MASGSKVGKSKVEGKRREGEVLDGMNRIVRMREGGVLMRANY